MKHNKLVKRGLKRYTKHLMLGGELVKCLLTADKLVRVQTVLEKYIHYTCHMSSPWENEKLT